VAYSSATPLDRTLATDHSVTITGLARKTTYFFQVLTRDAAGNLSSATGSFRTK
jgi:chitodextrinase